MRIVAGDLRGRTFVAPKGRSTRPTADRTRQALFNVLEHAAWSRPLRGARVLDLFAGSGALGLEALSRGAAFCLFVDNDPGARSAIDLNLEGLGLAGRGRVGPWNAASLGDRSAIDGPPFDVAFLDAPYRGGLSDLALAGLVAGAWMAIDSVVVVETSAGETVAAKRPLEPLDVRAWGAARIQFLGFRPV